MKSKKGQLGTIQAMIVPLAAVAILLVVGFLILSETKSQAIDKSDTQAHNLINLTISVDTATTVNVSCVHERDLTITALYNQSGVSGTLMDSANYTISGNKVTISSSTNATGQTWDSVISLNYSCKEHSYAINSTRTTQKAIDGVPGWLPIIVVTIIGAALIGLISLFAGKRQ